MGELSHRTGHQFIPYFKEVFREVGLRYRNAINSNSFANGHEVRRCVQAYDRDGRYAFVFKGQLKTDQFSSLALHGVGSNL